MTASDFFPNYKPPRLLLKKKQVVLAIILPFNKHRHDHMHLNALSTYFSHSKQMSLNEFLFALKFGERNGYATLARLFISALVSW